jgi:hypothetical protein
MSTNRVLTARFAAAPTRPPGILVGRISPARTAGGTGPRPGGTELVNTAKVTVTRYSYRGSKIPSSLGQWRNDVLRPAAPGACRGSTGPVRTSPQAS